MLAHYHVFCLWMDVALIHPYIHPSIHTSIHCGILSLSYPVRERQIDTHTNPETGTHRTKIGTDIYTQKQRCRDIETEM